MGSILSLFLPHAQRSFVLPSCSTRCVSIPGRIAIIQMQQHADIDYRYQCNTQSIDPNLISFRFSSVVTFAVTHPQKKRNDLLHLKDSLLLVALLVGCSICNKGQYLFHAISNKTRGSIRLLPLGITLTSLKDLRFHSGCYDLVPSKVLEHATGVIKRYHREHGLLLMPFQPQICKTMWHYHESVDLGGSHL